MMHGYIEKDWGTNFPESYLWCQANTFKRIDTSFFLSIADIPFKRFNFKGFICIFLVDKKEYRFTTYNLARIKNVEVNKNANKISILIKKNMYKLYVNIKRGDSVELIAPNSDGMRKVINESIGSEISIKLLKGKKILFEGSSANAGLEIVG